MAPNLVSRGVRFNKGRSGATLTEVLVSLLIMSIGIVSLTTMFPLSMLRTLKATQLTKGTDLRFNAESFIAMNPRLLADPDGNGVTNGVPEYFVIDPIGWIYAEEYRAAQGLAVGPPNIPGAFGNIDAANPLPFAWDVPTGRNLGGTNRYSALPAFAVGTSLAGALPQADRLAALPDTWVHQYDEAVINPTALPAGTTTQLDVFGLAASGWTATFTVPAPVPAVYPPPVRFRAVLESLDGTARQFRDITYATGDTISWSEDVNNSGALDAGEDVNGNGALDFYPLPSTFVPGRVQIQAQERRYTYLLTCRKETIDPPDAASVDVVVFADRSIDNPPEQEQLFAASFSTGSRAMSVTYAVGGNVPNAKKGGFVFDASNARWYRIISILDDKAGTMVIGLEAPTVKASPTGGGAVGRVMFPKAVVDVFPLGLKQP